MNNPNFISARAPGKIILFGEHAINRGQPALAASVGLWAECTASVAPHFKLRSATHHQEASREQILELASRVEDYRKTENYEAIRKLAKADYFAPQKYILASAFGEDLPSGLSLSWVSQVPSSSGLGSGGSAFTAMVGAILPFLPAAPTMEERAAWAHQGDIIAHGGIASALDTQTSLLGGVIRFTGKGLANKVPCAPGLSIVVGNTKVSAATSEVNSRVRCWLAEKPTSRMAYFQTIGALSRSALPLLESGNWDELGRLMNLNQLVLEKIGVSCPEIDRLIEAALHAGAYGAKISGSGGGGIIIALTSDEKRQRVVEAIQQAGGETLVPSIAVPGASDLNKISQQWISPR